MKTTQVKAYGTSAAENPLMPMDIDRREVTDNAIEIDILYCGVCHSDLHTARNDWGFTSYPAVPGHEIVGKVNRFFCPSIEARSGDHFSVGNS